MKKYETKKVLVACEESQRVCSAFRDRGFEAYSCDLIECSGGHPEWHIQQDVTTILNPINNKIEFIKSRLNSKVPITEERKNELESRLK